MTKLKLKPLTVRQLITLLHAQPQDALVVLEGCDCTGDCVGLTAKYGEKNHVLLRRSDGTMRYEPGAYEILTLPTPV